MLFLPRNSARDPPAFTRIYSNMQNSTTRSVTNIGIGLPCSASRVRSKEKIKLLSYAWKIEDFRTLKTLQSAKNILGCLGRARTTSI